MSDREAILERGDWGQVTHKLLLRALEETGELDREEVEELLDDAEDRAQENEAAAVTSRPEAGELPPSGVEYPGAAH